MSVIGAVIFLWGFGTAASAFGSIDKPLWAMTLALGGAVILFWGLQ